MASASTEEVGDAQEHEADTIRCTHVQEGIVTCVLPDASKLSIGQNVIDRSKLLAELLSVTAVGSGFEVPAGEGRPWLTCVNMTVHELQYVDDTQLIEFLKSSEYFQDNESLRDLYRTLGSRLFEFEANPTSASAEDPWSNDTPARQLKVLQTLTLDQATEVLRNSPYGFEYHFKFLPPEFRYLAAHAAVPGISAACSHTPPPPPAPPPKNPLMQFAYWGMRLVQAPKPAYLTLIVDGCQLDKASDSPVCHGSTGALPGCSEFEEHDLGSLQCWPAHGQMTEEDLGLGLFYLREGKGALSCRMLVHDLDIEQNAFQLKQNQALLLDASCAGMKLKDVSFEGTYSFSMQQPHSAGDDAAQCSPSLHLKFGRPTGFLHSVLQCHTPQSCTRDCSVTYRPRYLQLCHALHLLPMAQPGRVGSCQTSQIPCDVGGVVVLQGGGCHVRLENVRFKDTTLVVRDAAIVSAANCTFTRPQNDGICLLIYGTGSKFKVTGCTISGGLQGVAAHDGGTFEGRHVTCNAAGIIGLEAKDRGSQISIGKGATGETSSITNVNSGKTFGFYPSSKAVFIHSRSTGIISGCEISGCNGRGVEIDSHEGTLFVATGLAVKACHGLGIMIKAEQKGNVKLIDCTVQQGNASGVLVMPMWSSLGRGVPKADIRIQGGNITGNSGTGLDVDGVDGVKAVGLQSSQNAGVGFRSCRMGTHVSLKNCTSSEEEPYEVALKGRMSLSSCIPSEIKQEAESILPGIGEEIIQLHCEHWPGANKGSKDVDGPSCAKTWTNRTDDSTTEIIQMTEGWQQATALAHHVRGATSGGQLPMQ